MLKVFPVLTLTGTRQSGKSTLLKNMLPEYRYVSLEDPDIREFAKLDPRGFLDDYDRYTIFDEAQQVPELFSYIQTKVDHDDLCGQYILSGSHNFLLMDSISQSLAGRCAVMKLTPFSIRELKDADIIPKDIWELMLRGGFPRIYDKNIDPQDYFPSYIATYIERDVRSVRNISDSAAFIRFIRLCAARSGQILNLTELAGKAGITVPTVKSWLSVLEQSYVVFRLQPYYNNFSKRLVKSPKLYFYDTGLLCYLLGISSKGNLRKSDQRGSIFETMIVSEYVKHWFSEGGDPACFYWRDTGQNEIDLLTEEDGLLQAYEIKLADTMNRDFLKTMTKFCKWASLPPEQTHCIYRGITRHSAIGDFINYGDLW